MKVWNNFESRTLNIPLNYKTNFYYVPPFDMLKDNIL